MPQFVGNAAHTDCDTNLIFVVFEVVPDEVFASLRTKYDAVPSNIGIISIDDTPRSNPSNCDRPPAVQSKFITTVRFDDYARIVTIIDLYLENWSDTTTIYFGSLDTVIKRGEWHETFRFIHLLTNRIRQCGGHAQFYLNPTDVPAHTIDVISYLYSDVTGDIPPGQVPDQAALHEVIEEALEPAIRVRIVETLLEEGSSMSIHRLANTLARSQAVELDAFEDIHTALYHVHIPKLVEAGLVVTDEGHGAAKASRTAQRVYADFMDASDA